MIMKRICVLLTCHNRKEKTLRCVQSLTAKNAKLNFSFVIVDDGSTDGTKEALQSLENIDIAIINGDGNLFYSGGMRKAIEYAKNNSCQYDYYMLANDDVDFYDNTIEKMTELADNRIVVGVTDDGNRKMTYGGVQSRSKFRPSFHKVMSTETELVKCDTFNANCVVIPSAIFNALDNIDNFYVHGFGDYDYGLMASQRGYPIIATPFFVGMCKNNPIKGSWKDKSLSLKERKKAKEKINGSPSKVWYYFTKKHFGFFSAIAVVAYQYIGMVFKK